MEDGGRSREGWLRSGEKFVRQVLKRLYARCKRSSELDLLGEEIVPLTVPGDTHFFAPKACGSVFQGHIGSHLTFRFCEPHSLFSILRAHGYDKVWVELARTIVFIICNRETEALVLEVSDNIFSTVEKIRPQPARRSE